VDYGLQQTVAPANEPVTTADLKTFLRVDSDDTTQDTLIGSLGIAARQYAETWTGLQLCTATYQLTLDNFLGLNIDRFIGQMPPWAALNLRRLPQLLGSSGLVISRGTLWIPKPPLIAVSQIVYLDPNTQVSTPLDPTKYLVDAATVPGRIMPSYGNVWPVTWEVLNAATITFSSGFSADGTLVPDTIKTAIRLLVGHWYANREAVMPSTTMQLVPVPMAVSALLMANDYGQYR
jgi:hypothetical protein